MHLHIAVQNIFSQLSLVISMLKPGQYGQPCHTLSAATIGQHTRHIIELFQCLLAGYDSGIVNYEKRPRDTKIETDPQLAISLLNAITSGIQKPPKVMLLEAGYHPDSPETTQIETNFSREIAYNLEHTIHHMALIRVGLIELTDIDIPEGFGIASSTIKYRKACAQ